MSNGLTKREQESLSHTLKKLEAVGTRSFLYGNEGRQMLDLTKRIRERLTPADPGKLQAEAERLFSLLEGVPGLEQALAEMC
jgi:hypothetical protein